MRGSPNPETAICGVRRRQDDDGNRVTNGEPCRRPAGAGTDHLGHGPCVIHGGSLPSVAKAARDELALNAARRGLARLGAARPLATVSEAFDVLLTVAGQLDALRAGLQDEVEALRSVRYEHPRAGEQIRGEVSLLVSVSRELASLLAVIGKLNIAERRVELQERQFDYMQAIVEGTLRRRGVDTSAADVRADLYEVASELTGEGSG
jgi:hypothetical protein